MRQVIDDFGGGMLPGSTFKFALTGGAAGSIVPPSLLDIPMDYASGPKRSALGLALSIICDQSTSVCSFSAEELRFFAANHAASVPPCRVGTWRSFEICLAWLPVKASQGMWPN
ncbi:MAG: hypothetical protein MZV70_17325 [Desulfobacterales bacterium]|nr:hypothetical protein [Desulfobacterales bacterium]